MRYYNKSQAQWIFTGIYEVNKKDNFYKIKKGIYSDIPSVHYLAVIMKKYTYGVFTSFSAYYYHNLTDVIPNKIYLATNRNATTIISKNIANSCER